MYGVKFSLWLTGAVGPQAVAGRHSSTRPLHGAGIDVHRHVTILAPTTSIGELKNLVINYHLQSYVMDRSIVFFLNLGGC